MDTLFFLITLATGLAVLVWYLVNEMAGAAGTLGLFAIKPDEEGDRAAPRRAYLPLPTPSEDAGVDAGSEPTGRRYRIARRGFAEKGDDSAYRSR